MRTVRLTAETKRNLLNDLLKRSPNNYVQYEETVNRIIADVRANGDSALFSYTRQLDRCSLDKNSVRVTEEEIRRAYDQVDAAFMKSSFATVGSIYGPTAPSWGCVFRPSPWQASMRREERPPIRPAC